LNGVILRSEEHSRDCPQLRKQKVLEAFDTCVDDNVRAIPATARASEAIHRLRRRFGLRLPFSPVRKTLRVVAGKDQPGKHPARSVPDLRCTSWMRHLAQGLVRTRAYRSLQIPDTPLPDSARLGPEGRRVFVNVHRGPGDLVAGFRAGCDTTGPGNPAWRCVTGAAARYWGAEC